MFYSQPHFRGPICGYFGTSRFQIRLLYMYVLYWILRAVTDAAIVLIFGLWWFVISLLVDLYILRYIWQFCGLLKSLPIASLTALQNATDVNQTPQSLPVNMSQV